MRRTWLLSWFAILILGIFAVPNTHAQNGSIEGTVRAGDTDEPLPGANVALQNSSLGTTTDPNGTFRLGNVPVGSYTIQISFVGYQAQTRSVTVQANQTTTINVVLPLKSAEFDEMVVTASRQEERLREAPVQMEVITTEDLETFAGETLFSSLSTRKGIDYSRTGINQQSISMRGFDSHYNSRLVQMKDGYVAQTPGTGLPQGTYTPTSELDVRRIETIVGPASALYGPNAHLGVVNVITKTPWDESGVSLDVRGGQQDLLDVNGRAAGVLGDNFGWKVSGQYMSATDYMPPMGGPNATARDSTHYFGTAFNEVTLVEDYGVSSLRADGSLYYRFGDSWQLKGEYGLSINDNFSTTTFGRLRLRDYQLRYQNLELSSDNWLFRGTHTSNDGGTSYTLEALAFFAQGTYLSALQDGTPPEQARQQTLRQVPALRDSALFTLQGDLWDAEAQYKNSFDLGSGSIEFVTGAQLRKYAPFSDGTVFADGTGQDQVRATEKGAYLQVDYRPVETLRFNTAVRVDQFADYDTRVSPKAAVVYTFTEDQTLRLSYNQAYKSPELFHLNFNVSAFRGNSGGYTIRSGPSPTSEVVQEIDPLSQEKVTSVEAEYRGTFGDALSFNVIGYNSWYENFISPLTVVASPDPSIHPTASAPTYGFQDGELISQFGLFTYYNYDEAVIRGLDVGLEYTVDENLTLTGGLSLIEQAEATGEDFLPSLTLNVPETKLKGSLLVQDVGLDNSFFRISGRWKAAHEFRAGYWNSEFFYDDGQVPARFSAELSSGYEVPGTGLELQGSVVNLFDTEVPDKLGAPQTGRLITLSASYTLNAMSP